MKKVLIIAVVFIIFLNLAGCAGSNILPNRREIEDLELVRAIGVDKSPTDPEKIMLTMTSKKPKESGAAESGGGGGGGTSNTKKNARVLTSEAVTIINAGRQFQTYTDMQIFWGHTKFFIIGEEAARENIIKFIDAFTRDNDARLNSKIFVVKGGTAKEVLEQSNTGDFFVPDRLESMGHNTGFLSISGEVQVMDVMRQLDKHCSTAYIPTLFLSERKSKEDTPRMPLKDMELEGFSIFKNFKLVGFTNRNESRGFNFIRNKVTSGIIEVKDPVGQTAALEIINSETSITPQFEGDTLNGILVKTRLASNVNEIHSTFDIFKDPILDNLSMQQSNIIKSDIEGAINIAQKYNTDYLGISDIVYHKHPIKWLSLKDKWDTIFPDLKFTVQVESKINRTYNIREPNGSKAGEKQ